MKKGLVFGICLLVTAGLSFGQGLSVGAHGAYSIGGDVETETFGYGAQVGVAVNDCLSLELSGTMFSDEPESGTIDAGGDDSIAGLDFSVDILHIALTAQCGVEVMPNVRLYGGGGASYNTFDVDSPGLQDLFLAIDGGADYQMFTASGGTFAGGLDFNIDDAIGYHAAAGVSCAINEMLQVFAEYRFTWLDVDLEMEARIKATAGNGTVVFDETMTDKIDGESFNFGLARVGINILL